MQHESSINSWTILMYFIILFSPCKTKTKYTTYCWSWITFICLVLDFSNIENCCVEFNCIKYRFKNNRKCAKIGGWVHDRVLRLKQILVSDYLVVVSCYSDTSMCIDIQFRKYIHWFSCRCIQKLYTRLTVHRLGVYGESNLG